MQTQPFSGSYKAGSIEFLLKPLVIQMTSVEEKSD